MRLERTSQACYKYMAIFGELVPSWLYSQLQAIDPISGVGLELEPPAYCNSLNYSDDIGGC